MRFQYEVDINISIKRNIRYHLNMLTDTKEMAIKELKKWADKYRQEWGVPAESTEDWNVEVSDETRESVMIDFNDSSKNGPFKSRRFYGLICPRLALNEGDETSQLAGTVFKFNEFPHIMCHNRYPTIVNDPQIMLVEPIDMKEHKRVEWPNSEQGMSLATLEETEEYYNLCSAIIDEVCSRIN